MEPQDARGLLLVIEDDDELREMLALLLEDEGYETRSAATLNDALAALDEQSFDLILTDLFAHAPGDVLSSAQVVRERAAPTPVGVMTGWRTTAEEAEQAEFAFLVAKPFDVEQLLEVVAGSLRTPLTEEQERQAEVVRRYFAALGAHDWDALAGLCAEDVTYILPGTSPYADEIRGREPFRRYSEETFRDFPNARFEHITIHALPNGLIARYSGIWNTGEGQESRMSGVVVFHFTGERIQRIGVRLPDERFAALLGTAEE